VASVGYTDGVSKDAEPKRHHYVPRWHLKRFSNNSKNPRLWVFAKSRDAFYETSITNAAVIHQYYRWDSGDERAGVVEQGLAALDARAAEVLPRLERGHALRGTEPNVVAAYVATQRARVPAMRESIQELIETVGAYGAEQTFAAQNEDEMFARALEEGRVRTREEFDQMRRESLEAVRERKVKVTMEPIMNFALHMQNTEQLAWYIEEMSWVILEAAPGSEFLISDNPVTLRSSAPEVAGWPPAFGDPDVEITLPLSGRALLRISHDGSLQGRGCAVYAEVERFNRRTWEDAQEYVFGSSRGVLESMAANLGQEERCKPGGRVAFAWDHERQTFLPRATA